MRILPVGLLCLLSLGCYKFEPMETRDVAPGQEVRVWLSESGRTQLRSQLGWDLRNLEGEVAGSDQNGAFLLRVESAVQQRGFHSQRFQQEIALGNGDVLELERKQVDRFMTTAILVGGAVAVTAVAAGLFSGSSGGNTSPPTPSPGERIVPWLVLPIP